MVKGERPAVSLTSSYKFSPWRRRGCRIKLVIYSIVSFFMHVLSTVFLVGMAGSAIVVAISFVEDLHELLGE